MLATHAVTLARFALLPLFLGCALRWAGFMGDPFAFGVMVVFAFTNGYFASLGMMHGPGGVEPEERQSAGFLMTLFLQAGIFTGSQVSLGFAKLTSN
jgi:equilibrative nucleoside transporter 1/2/3